MMTFVKQYGYYRAGTNFTRAVLEANFDCHVLVNQLGCKHDPPASWKKWLANPDKPIPAGLPRAVENKEVRTVVTVKDPYGWLDSFLVYWQSKLRNRTNVSTAFLQGRVKRYSQCTAAWTERLSNAYVVPYEWLLQDLDQTVRAMGHAPALQPRETTPVVIHERVDPNPHLRGRPFDPRYFLEREYLLNLTSNQKQVVTQDIDWNLFKRWGYEALS